MRWRKLGLTPEALARSARRLRRARAALDHAADKFLAEHGAMSEAGYCLIARDALVALPEEIALRAAGAGGQRRRRPRDAAQACEARVAACKPRREPEGRAHARRLPSAACSANVSAFSVRREGLGFPRCGLLPGNARCGTTASELSFEASARAPVTVGALGEARWRDLRASAPWLTALPRFAGATLPACLAGRVDRASATWDLL